MGYVRLLRAWAREYVRMGYRVFPVVFKDKRPDPKLAPNGFKGATMDPEVADSWFSSPLSIGLVPGVGVVVLDVDSQEKVAVLEGRYPLLRTAPKSLSGGGGAHYFLAVAPEDQPRLKARVRALPDLEVDLRGLGASYVVAPPSLHPTGKPYRWARPLLPPERLPVLSGALREDILQALAPPRPDLNAHLPPGGVKEGSIDRRVKGLLDAVYNGVAALKPGERHQGTLRWGGWGVAKLRELGAPTSLLIEPLLLATETNGLRGENPREVEGIIKYLLQR